MDRLSYVFSAIDSSTFARLDRDSSLIVLGDAALASIGAADMIHRRSLVVAAARHAHAAALFADVSALASDAIFELARFAFSDLLSAAIWRVSARAKHLLLQETLAARAVYDLGLCDALIPADSDPMAWAEAWLGTRSVAALHAAASLIRRNRSDVAERVEFSRLFAAGDPQHGLSMFLEKRQLDFSDRRVIERI